MNKELEEQQEVKERLLNAYMDLDLTLFQESQHWAFAFVINWVNIANEEIKMFKNAVVGGKFNKMLVPEIAYTNIFRKPNAWATSIARKYGADELTTYFLAQIRKRYEEKCKEYEFGAYDI